MEWEIEFTEEFATWWNTLSEPEQTSIEAKMILLRRHGPNLGRPTVDSVKTSSHSNMKEVRIQHAGQPYRILFVFDPRRCAVLLVGGNKTGDTRWYEKHVPEADRIYDEYLKEIEEEGLI
jgi:hypothetical protein